MPLTGNVINEPIFHLISHQSILCAACLWPRHDGNNPHAHAPSIKKNMKNLNQCPRGWRAGMSAACRTGREMKVEVCVRSCHLGSDCKCSSKTAYRLGNQQPLPWHSTHRWPHFAVGADTYLSILGAAFLWLNFFPAPIPSLLQRDLYLKVNS